MTPDEIKAFLADTTYVRSHQFELLSEINFLLHTNKNLGRELLIFLLEKKDFFLLYEPVLNSLIEYAGLIPYLEENQLNSTADQIAYEYHRPIGLDDIVLHSAQMEIYQQLLAGENIILSAPTSFGKSLLIDAMIASGKYDKIVIIVPTIALIDETRIRLFEKFGGQFKIITHTSQQTAEHSIYILTQERFLEFKEEVNPDFFVIDEFYKLNHNSNNPYEERMVSLNSAFYKLYSSNAQFLLIGPNINGIKTIADKEMNFKFIRTDFKTVATDIEYVSNEGELDKKCIEIAQNLEEQTLIFCKSPASAHALADKMLESGMNFESAKAQELAKWLRENYHPDWDIANFIEHGIAIHYSALPRAISHYILKLFNDGALRFVLCTSTIIEGVNTSAKNIIVYDNKIAQKKLDLFTYNNIKGRAGRMFRYFVGKVFVLNEQPEDELPFIDIPVLSVPDDISVTLALDLPEKELSDYTKEQLKKLHAQNYLDVATIRKNPSVPAEYQIATAKTITDNIDNIAPLLNWTQNPDTKQLRTVCNLIFENLLNGTRKDDIYSSKQLNFKIRELQFNMPNGILTLIQKELSNKEYCKDATDAVERVLTFLRQWGEFNFPRLLNVLNDIQKEVLTKYNKPSGDYVAFAEQVKHWFLPPAATILEEYGIPFQVTLKICDKINLGILPDEIIEKIKNVDINSIALNSMEKSMLKDAISHL
ncbi:MAG: DEAD/DEAH box helicase [Lentisphaeria bacterium]|nr:DEAD/DEAH box helicase [Lentisphaeria bacterium]